MHETYQLGTDHLDIMGEIAQGKQTWEYNRLSVYDEIVELTPIYSIGGITVGTKQNFTIVKGKPKARKTFLTSAIVAACLSGKYENITSTVTGRILYIDTEQSQAHCQKVLRRICQASGLLEYEVEEKMDFVTLREQNTTRRLQLIEQAIHDRSLLDLEFVVIDGFRDLLHDINSPHESTFIIDKLMEWTASFDLHILGILHENKINDQLRGHIGTEGQNKAEAVIQVVKVDEKRSKVEPYISRNEDFDAFTFEIREGLPVPVEVHTEKNKPLEFDLELLKGIADGAFREQKAYTSKLAFNVACRKFYYDCTKKTIGEKKAYTLIEVMEAEDIIDIKYITNRSVEIQRKSMS